MHLIGAELVRTHAFVYTDEDVGGTIFRVRGTLIAMVTARIQHFSPDPSTSDLVVP